MQETYNFIFSQNIEVQGLFEIHESFTTFKCSAMYIMSKKNL